MPADLTPAWRDLVVAANRHSVCGRVARWLMHDLRGPAQALTLLTGILDDDDGQSHATIAETLRAATGHATSAIELLDRLLIYEPHAAVAGPVSLLDSLRFVASVYRVHHTPVALEIDYAERLPAVRGVSHEIELVLLNLVLNSLQSLRGQAGGRIRVTPSIAGASVRIAVSDNGPGVARAVEARLFEPFLSGWSDRVGAGLGLAVSRMLLERCGGSLAFVASDGPGASFVGELPVMELEGE